LAREAGLSPRFIAQLEAGRGNISVAKLDEVARVLEQPLSALLRPPGPPGMAAASPALRREVEALLEGRTEAELRAVRLLLRGERPADREAALPPVIALVGLRGAGKSTVGRLLGPALGQAFVELDDRIQERTGLALSEIFELHGEGYYRQVEREALADLIAQGAPAVVAVSGGAVTDPETMTLLRTRTLLVWLSAEPEQHMNRVRSQGDRRPMANRPDAMAELEALLRARRSLYRQARLIVDTSHASPRACVEELVAELRSLAGTGVPGGAK
jgi:XRE family aerobic/anaerobic benzoate catabolism transcriptional regulator